MHRTETESVRRRPSSDVRRPGVDLRCGCHRLLARGVAEGLELRCPRCKTNTLLTWAQVRAMELAARAAGPGAAPIHGPNAPIGDRG
ncbi:MAG: Com family DNA-binding transcriptional regulator [Polyangiales bacterium]